MTDEVARGFAMGVAVTTAALIDTLVERMPSAEADEFFKSLRAHIARQSAFVRPKVGNATAKANIGEAQDMILNLTRSY